MLTDEEIENCWLEAEAEADAPESEWLLYGQKVAAMASAAERKRCAGCIPTTWLDPALTGPAAIVGMDKADAPLIEELLRRVKSRILEPNARANLTDTAR